MLGRHAAHLACGHVHHGHLAHVEPSVRVTEHRRAAREPRADQRHRRAARARTSRRRHVVEPCRPLVLEQYLVRAEVLSVGAQLEREHARLRVRRRGALEQRRAPHVRTHERVRAHAHPRRRRHVEAAPAHAHERAAR